jgi:hypothetical protein
MLLICNGTLWYDRFVDQGFILNRLDASLSQNHVIVDDSINDKEAATRLLFAPSSLSGYLHHTYTYIYHIFTVCICINRMS